MEDGISISSFLIYLQSGKTRKTLGDRFFCIVILLMRSSIFYLKSNNKKYLRERKIVLLISVIWRIPFVFWKTLSPTLSYELLVRIINFVFPQVPRTSIRFFTTNTYEKVTGCMLYVWLYQIYTHIHRKWAVNIKMLYVLNYCVTLICSETKTKVMSI